MGVKSVTNPEVFSGGTEEEGDEALRERVLETFQRLPNGANAAWYEKTAMDHEGVAAAKAIGRARGIGTVDVSKISERFGGGGHKRAAGFFKKATEEELLKQILDAVKEQTGWE